MCGIAGSFGRRANSVSQSDFQDIQLRGPDSNGEYRDDNVYFAHTRLAIIDLESGAQPMSTERFVISYNGEIYNYKRLRADLEKHCVFDTTSDTEVILRGIEREGFGFLEKLDGMFAFSLLDKKTSELHLVRDTLGQKPLYYWVNDDTVFWSSTADTYFRMSDRTEVSIDSMNVFLKLGYIPAPFTPYKGLNKLSSGSRHTYVLVADKLTRVENSFVHVQETPDAFQDVLLRNVDDVTSCDVDLAISLSAGLDSTIIASFDAKGPKRIKKAFTFLDNRFKSRVSITEGELAKKFADEVGLSHEFISLDEVSIKEIQNVYSKLDEPFSDQSVLAMGFLAKKTRSEGFKVLIGGDAADEFLLGYNKYKAQIVLMLIKQMGLLSLLRKAIKKDRITNAVDALRVNDFQFYIELASQGMNLELFNKLCLKSNSIDVAKLIKAEVFQDINVNHLNLQVSADLDRKMVLEGNMFYKTDRLYMMKSIEYRSPFATPSFAHMASKTRVRELRNLSKGKLPLRKLAKDFLPKYILQRPKTGYDISLESTVKDHICPDLILNRSDFQDRLGGLINTGEFFTMIESPLSLNYARCQATWNTAVLYYWLRKKDLLIS